ncbi:carboxypeptidase-like regulatory domain-containing protein [Hymenobacter sp. BRD67]|uniref:carboxypeptidase-like regulatory domain-containing protein n=1 Tax=Hymenobacter sp. BRD67 TaxID=2675877 RepID=UPI001C253EB1|nr:carboxypeptidase-like regulatory domain-containing protein [Hymenobacter sp. BRD67]
MKHPYLVKLRFLLLLVLGLTASLGAWAQSGTGTVSGRVTDAKNEGLPGVTVLVEGTSIGALPTPTVPIPFRGYQPVPARSLSPLLAILRRAYP